MTREHESTCGRESEHGSANGNHRARPGAAALTAAAVIALLASCGSRVHDSASAPNPASKSAAPVTATPTSTDPGDPGDPQPSRTDREGMPGMVQALSAAFPSAKRWLVLVEQCHPDGMSCPDGRTWLASSADAGRHWRVRSIPSLAGVDEMVFPNRSDGWAADSDGRGALLVTHDGGIEWAPVGVPSGYDYGVTLSVADGEVWGLAQDSDPSMPPEVLRGRASGHTLSPVPGRQGADGPLVAGGANVAYVQAISPLQPSTGTDDAGRSWHELARACPWPDYAAPEGPPAAAGEELVIACRATALYRGVPKLADRRPLSILERSSDDGRRWTRYPNPRLAEDPTLVSPSVAWATCDFTEVCRSVDGGRTWKTVWEPTDRTGTPDVVVATSTADAAAVIPVSSGGRSSLLVVSTTDGGRRWTAIPLPLPDR